LRVRKRKHSVHLRWVTGPAASSRSTSMIISTYHWLCALRCVLCPISGCRTRDKCGFGLAGGRQRHGGPSRTATGVNVYAELMIGRFPGGAATAEQRRARHASNAGHGGHADRPRRA
jgi:hypothetical protein